MKVRPRRGAAKTLRVNVPAPKAPPPGMPGLGPANRLLWAVLVIVLT